MKENKSEAKQERKSEETPHKEFKEVTAEYGRVIREERKEVKVEIGREVERRESEALEKPILPKPPLIRLDLNLELKVVPPSSIALTNKQRILLYILYNFKGRRVEEALSIASKVLGMKVEELLHELTVLKNLNIVVGNGVISFTSRGEAVATTVVFDKNLVNRIWETLAIVPKGSSIHVPPVSRKLVDKGSYLASIKAFEKKFVIPVTPRLRINNISLVKIDKGLSVYPGHKAVTVVMSRIPRITIPELNVRALDKTVSIKPMEKREVVKKPIAKVVGVKKTVKSEGVRLPTSLLTMLFKPVKKYGVKGLLSVKPDRPVIVVAVKQSGEEYIATLLSILREIYRMKVSGLPIGRYVGTKAGKYIVEDEHIEQRFVKVIDDSKADFLLKGKVREFDEVDLDKLKDRLTELSIQGFSFLVFYINEDKREPLLKYLTVIRDMITPSKVIIVSPRKLDLELKKVLARASWGFVEPTGPLPSNTIDQHFKRREEEFYELLEEIASKRRYVERVRESVESEEGVEGFESALHYQLKVFLVYYLMKNAKKLNISKEEDIETEVELSTNGRKIVPDIYVKLGSKRLAIEIETFYGTGLTPWRKLQKTIEKYVGDRIVDEVWIVIPPLQTMLYLKDLVEKAKELEKEGYGFIKLYTINLPKRGLIPIKEIPRKLSKVFVKLT